MTADGAATVEALQAELARAKEQARLGNAAALKAAEELRAEKAAHGESQDKMANMAKELKAAADRCQVLEKENQVKASNLDKAAATRKDLRSAMRAKKEELREAGDIVAEKSFMLQRKFGDPRYALWIGCGVRQMHIWISRRALPMRPSTSKVRQIVKWTSFSSRNSTFQSVCFH